ncbi:MAB_1171c family putative transporter [Actinoplanes sp. DH11]|uniref:MAB_1171c family putative transporter n=1 Tax=Actinoplanes sp. DH11 TaxID=2857011 RepID=UPI001E45C608|nr:MAB_1171c family putative transporter [Actinoplanes sp. DH11]
MTVAAGVSVVLWVAVVTRLPSLRRDVRHRVLWANLLACALTVTLALPAHAAGRPAPVAAHLCAVVAAHLLLRFVCLVTAAGRPWAQRTLTGAVLAFMSVSALHEPPGSSFPPDAPTGSQVAYWTVVNAYLALVLLMCARACTIIGRAAPAGSLRGGLLTMAAGIAILSGYATVKALLITARGAGAPLDLPAWEPWVSALRTGGVLLYVGGGSVPVVVRVGTVLRAYHSLLVLRPLWAAMRDAYPEVVLMRPARAALAMTGEAGARLRVYRRVIEIRDGMLALRHHVPAQAEADAHGERRTGTEPSGETAAGETAAGKAQAGEQAAGEQAAGETAAGKAQAGEQAAGEQAAGEQAAGEGRDPAVVEARRIVVALRRRAAGAALVEPPGRWTPVGPEMADEVAWLSRVSRAFRREGKATAAHRTAAGTGPGESPGAGAETGAGTTAQGRDRAG